jgi:hypothetical protein
LKPIYFYCHNVTVVFSVTIEHPRNLLDNCVLLRRLRTTADALHELQPSLVHDITRVFKALERASNGGGQLGHRRLAEESLGNRGQKYPRIQRLFGNKEVELCLV